MSAGGVSNSENEAYESNSSEVIAAPRRTLVRVAGGIDALKPGKARRGGDKTIAKLAIKVGRNHIRKGAAEAIITFHDMKRLSRVKEVDRSKRNVE